MNQITFRSVKQTTQNQGEFKLGQRAVTPDGREWVYVKASAAVGTAGMVVVPAAVTSVGTTISSSNDSQGRTVFITKASAGWTVGAFDDGTVHIDNGTGEGQVAKIKTNTADTLELYPEDALATALSTDSTMKIWTNNLVRKSLTSTKVQNAVGVVQVAFASGDYGWALTRGIGAVISDTAGTIGKSLVTGGSTAGEATIGTTGKGGFDEQIVAVVISASTNVDKAQQAFVTLS
jgi:hypothetical protein